jgi:hypothetical protein
MCFEAAKRQCIFSHGCEKSRVVRSNDEPRAFTAPTDDSNKEKSPAVNREALQI